MGWTLFFMMIVLKVPLVCLGVLLWHAIKAVPDPADGGDGGARKPRPKRPHPLPPHSPRPRRGPHREPLPASPPRVRSVVAKARRIPR